MITLYKDGKFYDYGTKPDVKLYIKLGYTVKVLNSVEAEEFIMKRKVKAVWDKQPTVLKKRVAHILRNDKLTWRTKYSRMVRVLNTIKERAARIQVANPVEPKEWTLTEQLKGVYNDICEVGRFIRGLFTPVQAWQLQNA